MIYNESCLDTMSRMEDASVDLILTDPPYMTTELAFDKGEFDYSIFKECKRILKPSGWMFVFYPSTKIHHILDCGFRYKFEYVMVKNNPVMKPQLAVRPMSAHELIFALVKDDLIKMSKLYFDSTALQTDGKPYKVTRKNARGEYHKVMDFTRKRHTSHNNGKREGTSVLNYIRECGLHPTQKPQALMELICRGYCPKDGLVYDPFLGSGTSCAAAEKTGRKWMGSEINAEYFEIARKRLHLDHAKMEQFT